MTFENWLFTTSSKKYSLQGKPLPLWTVMLYHFSSHDGNKYDELCVVLEEAYNAGKAEGEKNVGR